MKHRAGHSTHSTHLLLLLVSLMFTGVSEPAGVVCQRSFLSAQDRPKSLKNSRPWTASILCCLTYKCHLQGPPQLLGGCLLNLRHCWIEQVCLFPPAKEIVKQHLGHLGLRSFEELLAVCRQHNVPVWPAWFLPRVAKEWRSISELCEARTGPSSWPVTSEVAFAESSRKSKLSLQSLLAGPKQKGEIRSLLGGLVSLPPSLPKCLQVWKPSDPIRRWSLTQIAEKFVRVAGEEHRSTHVDVSSGIRPQGVALFNFRRQTTEKSIGWKLQLRFQCTTKNCKTKKISRRPTICLLQNKLKIP